MAATRLIVLFNLKPGRSAAEYEAWARSTDLPMVNALPSIRRFELFKATGLLGSSGVPPYRYIEIIDVADMDRFGADVATAAMQAVAAEFQAWADPVFISTTQVGA